MSRDKESVGGEVRRPIRVTKVETIVPVTLNGRTELVEFGCYVDIQPELWLSSGSPVIALDSYGDLVPARLEARCHDSEYPDFNNPSVTSNGNQYKIVGWNRDWLAGQPKGNFNEQH